MAKDDKPPGWHVHEERGFDMQARGVNPMQPEKARELTKTFAPNTTPKLTTVHRPSGLWTRIKGLFRLS